MYPLVQESIYIIGGKYRKKKINFPDIPNLRPTTNRIRETLFNWLMHDIRGTTCLDAYAGSGALGLEAISRGASNLTLIENNADIYKGLKKTVATFSGENIEIIKADIETYLKNSAKVFDIVFLDPPFSQPFPENCVNLLANNNVMAQGGLLYVEYNSPVNLNPEIWQNLKVKRAGQVTYALYKKLVYCKILP